jgi:hypothetical protein
MAGATKIPNDMANRLCYVGIQTDPLVPVAPDFRLNMQPDITTNYPLLEDPDITGTFMDFENAAHGMPVHAGTMGGTLSFENLPSVNRLGLGGGSSPSISAAPAYTYDQVPIITRDEYDPATIQYNHQGDVWQAHGVRLGQYNIEANVGDPSAFWRLGSTLSILRNDQLAFTEAVATGGDASEVTMTGAGWDVDAFEGAWIFPNADTNKPGARQITGNTEDTVTVSAPFDETPQAGDIFLIAGLPASGLPALAEHKIQASGTRLFIDPGGTPLGTTQIRKRFISFNVELNWNLDAKIFGEDEDGPSGVYGHGVFTVTAQIQLEADRPDEWRQLKRLDEIGIRIEKLGPEIAPGVRSMARIDLPRGVWTERTKNTRNNNLTQTLAWKSKVNVPPVRFVTRNGLAILP